MLKLLPWALRPLPQAALQLPAVPVAQSILAAPVGDRRIEVLTPPRCRAVTLMRQCTLCSPDPPLVLFSALNVNWEHQLTQRRVWKEM